MNQLHEQAVKKYIFKHPQERGFLHHYILTSQKLNEKQLDTLSTILAIFPHSCKDWVEKFIAFDPATFDKNLLVLAANAFDGEKRGNTVLGVACSTGSISAIKKLIAMGANLDTPDHNMNKLALHWAISSSNKTGDPVRCLLEAGAKTHLITYDHKTPLKYAKSRGFDDAVTILELHHQQKYSAFKHGAIRGLFKHVNLPSELAKDTANFLPNYSIFNLALTCKKILAKGERGVKALKATP